MSLRMLWAVGPREMCPKSRSKGVSLSPGMCLLQLGLHFAVLLLREAEERLRRGGGCCFSLWWEPAR